MKRNNKSLVKKIGIRGSVAVLLAMMLVGIGVAGFFYDYATISGDITATGMFKIDDVEMENVSIPFSASGLVGTGALIGNYTINCSNDAVGVQMINVKLISPPEVNFTIDVIGFGVVSYDQTYIQISSGGTVYLRLSYGILANATADNYACSMRLYPNGS